ncbi:hypothetical protein QBC39DRAFT_302450 [Podospora conica]|nr:hypothetical protein QBC39DRAFT_302450 [Schizothecium conicum]
MAGTTSPPKILVVVRTESGSTTDSLFAPGEQFSWLEGDARGPEYVSYSQLSDLPACSFDFGDNGYAASSNYGGEVLQMTTPSDEHGIIFARGDFEYSLYLALARGQKERGGKSSFGLKVASSDEFATNPSGPRYRPCCMIERGTYNYRWPFNEFCLHIDNPPASSGTGQAQLEAEWTSCICPVGCRDVDPCGGRRSMPVGTFATVSFIRGGILYQLLRLDPRHQEAGSKPVEKAELILTIEGPMRLQSFRRLNQRSKEGEIVLGECNAKEHADSACLAGTLDGSTIHWQADLFRFDLSRAGPATRVPLKPLKDDNEKKDHCFKTDDNLESLPRFQAELSELETKSCHVFVAAFRLVDEASSVYSNPIEMPPHEDVRDFLRSGCPRARGTASMWRSIFSQRQENLECISELCEENIVGRCLEKILSVDVVPASVPLEGPKPLRHLALVSNMFLRANVDLKAVFWKTRFLVKVDQLLYGVVKTAVEGADRALPFDKRSGDQAPNLQAQCEHETLMSAPVEETRWYKGADEDIIVAEATIRRIRRVLGETMAYMVRTLLRRTSRRPILLPDAAAGDFTYYYVMITICYVVRNYPKARWCWQEELGPDETQTKGGGVGWGLGDLKNHLPSRRTSPGLHRSHAVTRVRTAMLEWLHHESILSLQKGCPSGPVIPSAWHTFSNPKKAEDARRAAKTELVRRIASAQPYRPDDEVADRLAFLAQEMWPELDEADQIANRITRRVEDREVTRTIDLCHFDPGHERSDEGPWEVHALCHHSRFAVAIRKMCTARHGDGKETEEQVEHYRKKFYPFLTSEASLTPCWERNNSTARRGFLRSEATAVLGATLIDMCQADMEFFREQSRPGPPSTVGRRPSITVVGAGSDVGRSASVGGDGPFPGLGKSDTYAAKAYLRERGEKVDTNDLLLRQLETLEQIAKKKGLERQIDYLQFRPPQRYHPEEFFNSLDDTPELYEDAAMDERELKMPIAVREVLAERHPGEDREVVATTPSVISSGGIEDLMGKQDAKRLRELLVGKRPRPTEAGNIRVAAEQLKKLAVIDLVTPDPLPLARPKPIRDGRIVKVISDSLIDQEVRHRFLVVRSSYSLPVGLLRILVHVLHPEMIECFNHHQLHVSRFGLWTRQVTAVVHITLRSWALQMCGNCNSTIDEMVHIALLPQQLPEEGHLYLGTEHL